MTHPSKMWYAVDVTTFDEAAAVAAHDDDIGRDGCRGPEDLLDRVTVVVQKLNRWIESNNIRNKRFETQVRRSVLVRLLRVRSSALSWSPAR